MSNYPKDVWWPAASSPSEYPNWGHYVIIISWNERVSLSSHSLILPRLVLTPLPESECTCQRISSDAAYPKYINRKTGGWCEHGRMSL